MTLTDSTRASAALRVKWGDTPTRHGRCEDQVADLRARHPPTSDARLAALALRARRKVRTRKGQEARRPPLPELRPSGAPLRPDPGGARTQAAHGSAGLPLTHPPRAGLVWTQTET